MLNIVEEILSSRYNDTVSAGEKSADFCQRLF